MEGYKKKNDNFINLLEEAYEKFPLLRLFYGQQFIQLFNQTKNKENKNIFHLINSVTLNHVNNMKIDYEYNKDLNELENINNYLEILFKNTKNTYEDKKLAFTQVEFWYLKTHCKKNEAAREKAKEVFKLYLNCEYISEKDKAKIQNFIVNN